MSVHEGQGVCKTQLQGQRHSNAITACKGALSSILQSALEYNVWQICSLQSRSAFLGSPWMWKSWGALVDARPSAPTTRRAQPRLPLMSCCCPTAACSLRSVDERSPPKSTLAATGILPVTIARFPDSWETDPRAASIMAGLRKRERPWGCDWRAAW